MDDFSVSNAGSIVYAVLSSMSGTPSSSSSSSISELTIDWSGDRASWIGRKDLIRLDSAEKATSVAHDKCLE
jgi:hypothetical protein